jgi:hypothetical protein
MIRSGLLPPLLPGDEDLLPDEEIVLSNGAVVIHIHPAIDHLAA